MTSVPCPRCGTNLAVSVADAPCTACGLRLPAASLAEFEYLVDLSAWTDQRREYLIAAAAAQVPVQPVAAPVVAPTPTPFSPQQYGGPAGYPTVVPSGVPTSAPGTDLRGCLLSAGALALIVAALAFAGFAWSAVGEWGRFLMLMAAGAVAIGISWFAARKVPGTADASAIVGTFFFVIACAYLLVVDPSDDGVVSTIVVLVIGAAGLAASFVQGRRMRAAGALSALAASFLILATLASVPGRTDLDIHAALWLALTFGVWGAAMYAIDLVDDLVPWSWLGGGGVYLGLVSAVIFAAEGAAWDDPHGPLIVTGLLVGSALLALVLDRVTSARWWSLPSVALALLVTAAMTVATRLGDAPARPWISLSLVAVVAGLAAAVAHVENVVGPRTELPAVTNSGRDALSLTAAGAWVGALLLAAGLAIALTAWTSPPERGLVCTNSFCRPTYGLTDWINATYTTARAIVVGIVSVSVLGGVAWLAQRVRLAGAGLVGFVLAGLFTMVWLAIALTDTFVGYDLAPTSLAYALLIAGAGVTVVGPFVGQRIETTWFGAVAALVAVQWMWSDWNIGDWRLGPEVHGLLLAVPLVIAGLVVLLLDDDGTVSSVPLAPALVVGLLPSTFAMVDGLLEGFFGFSSTPSVAESDAVIRWLVLLALGVALSVIGARLRLAALFWPGIALTVLTIVLELLLIARETPVWITLAIAGVVLLVAGARWEWVQRTGGRTAQWAGTLR